MNAGSAPSDTTAKAEANEANTKNVGKVASETNGASEVARASDPEIESTVDSTLSVESGGNRRTQDGVLANAATQPLRAGGSVASSGEDPKEPVTADPVSNVVPEGAKAPDEDLPTSGSWPDFFNTLDLKGVIHNVASHFELIQAYDRTLCFAIAPGNATLYNERHQRGLASAIELALEEAVEVLVSIQATSDNTPARHREILEQQRLNAAKAALQEDDFLSALLTDFDAVVIPDTVRPPLTEL